jgi:CRP/FNR family transcriptional regulator
MTRQEIGSYLGLKLETVSRALSALNTSGVIQVHQRSIDIVDAAGLQNVIDPASGIAVSVPARVGTGTARADANNKKRSKKPQFRTGLALQQLAAA